jgi:serine/threonine protein kinase
VCEEQAPENATVIFTVAELTDRVHVHWTDPLLTATRTVLPAWNPSFIAIEFRRVVFPRFVPALVGWRRGGAMNNYHIYSEIGRGKGSVVYKGREKKTINYVAIKSVEKQYKNKVLNEVAVLYSLNHPNILKFLNWYETSKHIWLIVEFCPGGDLLAMIRLDQAMPEYSCKRFARDILSGLQFIHARGYIYGDLKPSNILVNEYGTLLLCDFGLSKKVMTEEDYQKQQADTNKRGSPYYMSPELFYSDGIHSYASDLWAFGAVLYELATGRPPFYSKSLEDVVTQILESDPKPLWTEADGDQPIVNDPTAPPPQPPHRFSRAFQHLLTRCLEKDPAKRITWPELRRHEWMRGVPHGMRLPELEMPDQPVFERLFMSPTTTNGSAPSPSASSSSSNLSSTLRQSLDRSDVLRLSVQAQRNRLVEREREKQAGNGEGRQVEKASGGSRRGGAEQERQSQEMAKDDEIEEDLDGANGSLDLPNYDTELNFSARAEIDGESSDVPTAMPPSSHGTARPSSTSASGSQRTFREPAPRMAGSRQSEIDEMEAQLAKLHAEEEEEDSEKDGEEQYEEDHEQDWQPEEPQEAFASQRGHSDSTVHDDDYEDAIALNPRSTRQQYDEADEEGTVEAEGHHSRQTSFSANRSIVEPPRSSPSGSPASSPTLARKGSAGASRLPVLASRNTTTTATSTAAPSRKTSTSKPGTSSGSSSSASSARSTSRTSTASSSSSSSSRKPAPGTPAAAAARKKSTERERTAPQGSQKTAGKSGAAWQ